MRNNVMCGLDRTACRTTNVVVGLVPSGIADHGPLSFPAVDANYTVSQKKNCADFSLTEFRQISTNFGNFWQKDSKEAKIMRGAFSFHLTQFASPHYRV